MLKAGMVAPEFRCIDHNGRLVVSSELRGKTVVLWFFPRADTPGCTAEGCSFRDLASEYGRKNAIILGVSFDDRATNAAFHTKYHFTFPLLCDTSRAMGLAYGACDDAAAPTARRIGVVIGPDGKIVSYEPKVDARTWPTDLVQQL